MKKLTFSIFFICAVTWAQKDYEILKKDEIPLLYGNWISTNYKGRKVAFKNDMQRNPKGFCSISFSNYPKNDPGKLLTLGIVSRMQNSIKKIMISDGHGGGHRYEPIEILFRKDKQKMIVHYLNTNLKEYYIKE